MTPALLGEGTLGAPRLAVVSEQRAGVAAQSRRLREERRGFMLYQIFLSLHIMELLVTGPVLP